MKKYKANGIAQSRQLFSLVTKAHLLCKGFAYNVAQYYTCMTDSAKTSYVHIPTEIQFITPTYSYTQYMINASTG